MSLSTPSLITPSLHCWACAPAAERTTAAAAAKSFIFIVSLLPVRVFLDAEVIFHVAHARLEFFARDHVDHLAVLDDVEAVCHRGGKAEILFDQQDRETLLLHLADGIADLLDDDGRQPLGGLVEEQEFGAGA